MFDQVSPADLLPHRYPFLLVDRILEIVPGKRAIALKNVTINEPFFSGHFPGQPVMPGVLILETMAQVGACALLADDRYKGRLAYLAGIDRVRFKKNVVPGDIMMITTELQEMKRGIGKGQGRVFVDDKLVSAGEFLFALSQKES
jgi:3-hydroxyacyl-[acyl-carrier-protein] dehydratase